MSSFVLTSNSSSVGSDEVEAGAYHDADSSKTTSRLTQTAHVECIPFAWTSILQGYISLTSHRAFVHFVGVPILHFVGVCVGTRILFVCIHLAGRR